MRRPGRTEIYIILGFLFTLVISHLPVVYTLFYHNITKFPSAVEGSLHLSLAPGEKRVVLDGEWEFYWQRLLITEQQQDARPDFHIRVPDYWSKYQINGEYLPAHGFASYRLILETGESSRPVTVFLPDFGSAYKVFINGTLASESGIVAKNPAEVFTTTKANIYPVTLPAGQKHELGLEVASTRFSGLYMAPVLTGYDTAVQNNNLRNNIRFMLFGAAVISFFVLLVWYILSFKTSKLSIWLPFIGLFVLLRIMLTTDFYYFWQDNLFFGFSYDAINPLIFFFTFAFKYLLIFLVQEILGIAFSHREKLLFLLYYIGLYLLYLFIPAGFYNR